MALVSDVGWARLRAAAHPFTEAVAACADTLARRWLLLVNLTLGLVVSGAVITPLLYALGVQPLGSALFAAYRFICGQVPSHSYYVSGYQFALCARNLAIYGSLLAGSLLFRAVRGRLHALTWLLWLLTMAPMALDGFTQLFGLRESNWELRTLTGVIFGLGVCWFLLPQIETPASAHDAARTTTEVSTAAID